MNYFRKILLLSERLRTGYIDSLESKNNDWEKIICGITGEIPELFHVIYNNVSGTKRSIKNQRLMDFIPGYRLIHICELKDEMVKVNEIYHDKSQVIIPFLGNYSSDYICYCKNRAGKEYIGAILHDESIIITMHHSVEKFFETICAFYKYNVYFLDSDGYLDYDMDLEGEFGAKINPGIEYWLE